VVPSSRLDLLALRDLLLRSNLRGLPDQLPLRAQLDLLAQLRLLLQRDPWDLVDLQRQRHRGLLPDPLLPWDPVDLAGPPVPVVRVAPEQSAPSRRHSLFRHPT